MGGGKAARPVACGTTRLVRCHSLALRTELHRGSELTVFSAVSATSGVHSRRPRGTNQHSHCLGSTGFLTCECGRSSGTFSRLCLRRWRHRVRCDWWLLLLLLLLWCGLVGCWWWCGAV